MSCESEQSLAAIMGDPDKIFVTKILQKVQILLFTLKKNVKRSVICSKIHIFCQEICFVLPVCAIIIFSKVKSI